MNMLILNGSPKGEGSNTLKLAKAFAQGFGESEPTNLEILQVNRLKIQDCVGCFQCWNKTPGTCWIQDDMAQVIEKIRHADVLIWSFPLYYFSMPSRIKALMDRQLPMVLPFMKESESSGGHPSRYDDPEKKIVVISTCGFYTSQGNYEAIDRQFSRVYGATGFTSLYCGQGELFSVEALRARTQGYLTTVQQAGREFAQGAISENTRNSLNQLLFPRGVFEEMADASWGIDTQPSEIQASESETRPSLGFSFTKQMAALYNPSGWQGNDLIIESYYTDLDETYQLHLKETGHSTHIGSPIPYTTRIETPLSLWKQIGDGKVDGQQAMMDKKYRVLGDFSVMLRWDALFGVQQPKETSTLSPSPAQYKTNMGLMLTPWIVLWVLLSINPTVGAVAAILSAALLPLGFLKWKPTLFEYLTTLFVSGIGVLALLKVPYGYLLPGSYLLFGLMWLGTVFVKIPLTAYYSMNDYNGEKALKNPLFIRTNRILTGVWGAFYLLTALGTVFLLCSPAAQFTWVINTLLPAGLGAFTAWFQKWYPAKYAAR